MPPAKKSVPASNKQEIYFGLGGNLVNQIYQVGALLSWVKNNRKKNSPRIFLYNASPHRHRHILDHFPYKEVPANIPKLTLPKGKGNIEIPEKPLKLNVTGFCQSHLYTSTYRDSLRKTFHLEPTQTTLNFLQKFKAQNLVFIHIRRGDYCVLNIELPMNYYDEAIQKMRQVVHGDISFIVFSDDVDFCKKYFQNSQNTEVIESMDPINTLRIMACCQHAIIANSTFSCWPAYYVKGTVIAPIDSKALKHFDDLLLDHWIRLSF